MLMLHGSRGCHLYYKTRPYPAAFKGSVRDQLEVRFEHVQGVEQGVALSQGAVSGAHHILSFAGLGAPGFAFCGQFGDRK